MKYVDIYELREGRYRRCVRVWEDGRAEGEARFIGDVMSCRRRDPGGAISMRGEGLLRRLGSCYHNGYCVSAFGEAEVVTLPLTYAGRGPRWRR